jgi:hypothetical protein
MPPVAKPREGRVLEAKGRPLPFSFFPVTRTNRRYGLYDTVFAVTPWTVMGAAIANGIPKDQQTEAFAFLEQAEDFYAAASSGISTNPLLTYYAFLNLAKVLIRARGYTDSLDRAMHGLKEETAAGGTELDDSVVEAKDGGISVNVFPELIERLGYPRPANNDSYPIKELLPQVVVGHRIWRESKRGLTERFVALRRIEFVDDRDSKDLWLRLFVGKGDLSRYEITRKRLLEEGGLAGAFHEVATKESDAEGDLVCLEQSQALSYTGRPTDMVADLVEMLKPKLWRIVSSIPGSGYRRYYLYLHPAAEGAQIPQLAAMWALTFYFGSVVRYRPHLFDEILRGPNGAFVSEFISSQPEQMLYLFASELCRREIARPAIV